MPSIHYLKGDATLPQSQSPAVIAHICNDQGLWGKGFVLALSARWTQAGHAVCRNIMALSCRQSLAIGIKKHSQEDGGALRTCNP